MMVILRESVENLGHVGDLVKVTPGYARNFLFPNKKAVFANEKNRAAIEHQKKGLEKKRLAQKDAASELSKKLASVTVKVGKKVGEQNKIFGSVSTADIAESLKKLGFEVARRAIHIDAPIKQLGDYVVTAKLAPEVTADVKIQVIKEE
ncbi:MAG: 50S ribosomal protein L9 [Bdellovibrionales bacterium]|nr:50S ribosomal protein L9 [Bdellovibrionales bacterium]